MKEEWWLLGGGFKYFFFSPLVGEDFPFDEHIFQMGWLKPPTRLIILLREGLPPIDSHGKRLPLLEPQQDVCVSLLLRMVRPRPRALCFGSPWRRMLRDAFRGKGGAAGLVEVFSPKILVQPAVPLGWYPLIINPLYIHLI